ncbi:MAG: alpha/beta fold hydrolase [Bacteroidia bacterium]
MTDREIEAHYKPLKIRPKFSFDTLDSGRKIYFAEAGNDSMPLLVFIHGAPGAWYGYLNYVDDSVLQKNFHILAIDRPGYGKSDYGKSLVSIAEQAEAIAPLVAKKKNGQPVIFVGRSYGGPVAAHFAINHPELTDAVIMLAPALDPAHEKFWWFSKPVNSRIMRWMLPKAVNVASDEKFSHVAELTTMLPLWAKLKTPITVVQGSEDQVVDTANFTFAKKIIPPQYAQFIWLKGEDHFIAAHQPEFVKKLIFQYADSLKLK